MGMPWALAGAGALLALTLTAGPAAASCVGPRLDNLPQGVQPSAGFGAPGPAVAPGGRITVYGHRYTSTCNDTGGNDPLVPLDPAHVTVRLPGGRRIDVGTFTPSGPEMGFTTAIEIPAGAASGIATVDDGLGGPPFTFTVNPDGVADATITPSADEGPSGVAAVSWYYWAGGAALLSAALVAVLALRRGAARTR